MTTFQTVVTIVAPIIVALMVRFVYLPSLTQFGAAPIRMRQVLRSALHLLDTRLGFCLMVVTLTAAYPLTIWVCLTWVV